MVFNNFVTMIVRISRKTFLKIRKKIEGTSTNYVTQFSGFSDPPLPLHNKKTLQFPIHLKV
jgi:hypothetical protein